MDRKGYSTPNIPGATSGAHISMNKVAKLLNKFNNSKMTTECSTLHTLVNIHAKKSTDIVKAAQTLSEPNSLLNSCSLYNIKPKLSQNEHKEESGDEQLFNDPLLDSEISWQDDVMGLKLSDKPPMFLSSETGTNNHKDTTGGYLCGSPNPYGLDVNMDMSLIRSLQFDNWDFHCDQILSSEELQAGL